jgi:DNA-binding PadR family transcriptional regulator
MGTMTRESRPRDRRPSLPMPASELRALTALALEADLDGLTLAKRAAIRPPSVYQTIGRLVSKGLVLRQQARRSSGYRYGMYALTKDGLIFMKAWFRFLEAIGRAP